MVTVVTYGTFDLFHLGHVRLLKRARQLGDRLIVGLSSDEFNLVKGKKSFFSYEERKEILLSCKFVDDVFPEYEWEQKRSDLRKYNADIFCMGDDWRGKFDDLSDICEVVYLDRTKDISTTDIKRSLALIEPEFLDKLEYNLKTTIDLFKDVTNALRK